MNEPDHLIRLPAEDRMELLRIARQAIGAAASGNPLACLKLEDLSPALQVPGATFVTLTIEGELRGCIGGLQALHPLALDVQKHAVAAALEDPRFPPVGPEEVDRLNIEISVLSTPQPLHYSSPDELVEKLNPGVDGVTLQSGFHRGTFLPQVWEKAPQPAQFLELLCLKAQLPRDAWLKEALEVKTYRVLSFHEVA